MIEYTLFPLTQNSLDALGMVFLHSLWQFTLIAALASYILKKNLIRSSQTRYLFTVLCMTTIVLVSMGTFYHYYENIPTGIIKAINPVNISSYEGVKIISEKSTFPLQYFEMYQEWILLFWILGILFLSIKLLGSLLYLTKLKRAATYPGNENAMINQWNELRKKWKIRKNIKLGFSNNIPSPVLIGQLKPVILFPFSLVNQLSPTEVEFILLHEMAHYTRYDWWVNIMQSFVEIIFYYHPAVYYISQLIREERESCCDDYAIRTLGGQNIAYAKTLIKLQEWESGHTPGLAVAFANKNQYFMDRIKKILNMNQTKNVKSENILIGLIIVSSLFFATRESIARNIDFQKSKDYLSAFFTFVQSEKEQIALDSIPKKSESITIIKKENDKEVKLEMENGEIKQLEIDGQKIQPEEYHKYEDVTKDIKIRTFKNGESHDPHMFYFGMGDKAFQWDGKVHMQMDSMLSGLMKQNSENRKMWSEGMKQEMQLLKEKMIDQKHFFHLDSLMVLPGFGHKEMPHFFHHEFPEIPGQPNFEFIYPGDDQIAKGYRFKEKEALELEKHLAEKHRFFDREGFSGTRNINEVLGIQLNKDGFLLPNKENKVELTGKHLKINGEKQPSNIWHKYKRIFEEETGTTLEKKSKISFHFLGKEPRKKYQAF